LSQSGGSPFANVQAGAIVNIKNGSFAAGGITMFTNGGTGITTVASQNHGLSLGDRVVIAGTVNYNGSWPIIGTITASTFQISTTFVANDAMGTWTRANGGIFDISIVATNSITLNASQLPTISASQSNVNWQVNACGTNGSVGTNTLTDLSPAFNSVSTGDTLWITAGKNTGVYPNITKVSSTTLQLASGSFRSSQTGSVCWMVTKGALVNNTSAFQAAIDAAAAAGGGVVYIPEGYYYFTGTQSLVVRSNVILRGMRSAPPFWRNDFWEAGVTQGPVLLAAADPTTAISVGSPFIILQGNNCSCIIEGLTIFYPLQYLSGQTGGISFSVIQYPYCIDMQTTSQGPGCDNRVMNMQLVNPFQGIRLETASLAGSGAVGRNHISNVYGSPLSIGISINNLGDVCYIEKVNFSPNTIASYVWVSPTGAPSLQDWNTYYVQNVTAIQIRNVNWIVLQDIFALLVSCGIKIVEDTALVEAELFGSNIQFDQADIGLHLVLKNAGSFLDVEFTNLRITTNPIGALVVNNPDVYQFRKCIYGDPSSVASANGALAINTGSLTVFGGGADNIVDWEIPSNSMFLTLANIWFGAHSNTEATGLFALYGRVRLQGCQFSTGAFAQCFNIGPNATSGIIYGNDYWDNTPGTNYATASQAMNMFGGVCVGINSPTNPGQLHVYGTPSGGSGDYTNISNPQLKVVGAASYWRIAHLSASSTISGVHNYETGKDVYWGETSDTGTYHFRGRNFAVEGGNISVGSSGPQILSGSGAPAGSAPNGSLYLRTDGTGPNLYVRQNGAWVSK
jgi:hypothetical protein